MRPRLILLLAVLAPASAWATGLGPPLSPPPQPLVPLGPVEVAAPPEITPPVAAPPIELTLPNAVVPHALLSHAHAHAGPPPTLPPHLGAIPDLTGVVSLPEVAQQHVLGRAPPFGGAHPGVSPLVVPAVLTPEPGTAALLALGLVGLAARHRR